MHSLGSELHYNTLEADCFQSLNQLPVQIPCPQRSYFLKSQLQSKGSRVKIQHHHFLCGYSLEFAKFKHPCVLRANHHVFAALGCCRKLHQYTCVNHRQLLATITDVDKVALSTMKFFLSPFILPMNIHSFVI